MGIFKKIIEWMKSEWKPEPIPEGTFILPKGASVIFPLDRVEKLLKSIDNLLRIQNSLLEEIITQFESTNQKENSNDNK